MKKRSLCSKTTPSDLSKKERFVEITEKKRVNYSSTKESDRRFRVISSQGWRKKFEDQVTRKGVLKVTQTGENG